MITGLSFVTVVVSDQEAALEFYTNKLDFEKRMDINFRGLPRFLTVAPQGQKEPEIVLVKAGASSVESHGGHTGMVLSTDDCRKDYATLKELGVNMLKEPTEQPFGIETLFADPDGNVFSLTQPRTRATG